MMTLPAAALAPLSTLTLVSAMFVTLAGCRFARTDPADTPPADPSPVQVATEEPTRVKVMLFQLLVLEEDWNSLGLTYEFEPAWQILKSRQASSPAFRITQGEIESYHWTQQALTLTPEASDPGKLVVTIRPTHSGPEFHGFSESRWRGIKDPRVEAIFAEAGKLVR